MAVKTIRAVFLGALFVALVSSCDSYITRTNDSDDIAKAEQFAASFYRHIGSGQVDSAKAMFASNLSEEDGAQLLSSIRDLRGSILSANTKASATLVETKNGKETSVQSSVLVDVSYEKGKAEEELIIGGTSMESLEIQGYNFTLK